jgi:hypothetical protein
MPARMNWTNTEIVMGARPSCIVVFEMVGGSEPPENSSGLPPACFVRHRHRWIRPNICVVHLSQGPSPASRAGMDAKILENPLRVERCSSVIDAAVVDRRVQPSPRFQRPVRERFVTG